MDVFKQEVGSIQAAVLQASGNPQPYYQVVPQSFRCPSVYFPQVEVTSTAFNLGSYQIGYVWYIHFFGIDEATSMNDDGIAMTMAYSALEALQRKKNIVRLIDDSGEHTGQRIMLKNPSVRKLAHGVMQLTLSWETQYRYDVDAFEPMETLAVIARVKEVYESLGGA